MKLYFIITKKEINFDLKDFLDIIVELFEDDSVSFELYEYNYNGVKGDWRSINQNIISHLGSDNNKPLTVSLTDFIEFSKFIGQTEDCNFTVYSKNFSIKVEAYDSYCWDLSSDNEEIIFKINNRLLKYGLEPEISI